MEAQDTFTFEDVELHWADYVVFGGFLVIITIVGIIIGVINRRKATNAEFLKAGSDMHFFPVAFSIQASFLSAIFIVSIPAESYNFGIGYSYLILSYFITFPLIGRLFLPVFFKLKITSAYEYLELRFNKPVRVACAIAFLLEMILYISVVIYTPALTMQTVMPLPTYACILLVSGVCIIYTVIGGMRATIWNDLIQMTVVMACLSMLIGFGHSKTGTLREVYHIASNGSRLDFNIFKPNPTTRTTFWSQVVGGTFLNFAMYAASQTTIQKALSTSSIKNAQNAMLVVSFLMAIVLSLVMWLGIVMYAFYSECDPQLSGQVEKADQIVPLFMMAVMGEFHGLPGLFLAATFSGALSSVSGGLNSMSAVVLLDFIEPVYKHYKRTNLPEKISVILTRCLVVFIGIIVTILAFVVPYVGDLILTIALSIFGMVGGPICGVLAAGLFMPCVNAWGALVGLLVGLGVTMWVGIGTMVAGPPLPYLPHSVEGCPVENTTFDMTSTSTYPYTEITDWSVSPTQPSEEDDVFGFYKLSYMYYGMVAIGSSMITAVLVSLMSGLQKDTPNEYIYSCADTCCKCCPRHIRECCRCGSLPPEEDLDEVVEILEVHFKKKAGSGVAGLEHPVRQLSFTLTNDLILDPKASPTDKESHSLHTVLYRNSFMKDNTIVEVPEVSEDQSEPPGKFLRHDSGINTTLESDKDSSSSSRESPSAYSTVNQSRPGINGIDESTDFGAEQSTIIKSGDDGDIGRTPDRITHSRLSNASSMDLTPLVTSSPRQSNTLADAGSKISDHFDDNADDIEETARNIVDQAMLTALDSFKRNISDMSSPRSETHSVTSRSSDIVGSKLSRPGSMASEFESKLSRAGSMASEVESKLSRACSIASEVGSKLSRAGSMASEFESKLSRAGSMASEVESKLSRAGSMASEVESKLSRAGSMASEVESKLPRAGSMASKVESKVSRASSMASEVSDIGEVKVSKSNSAASRPSDKTGSSLSRVNSTNDFADANVSIINSVASRGSDVYEARTDNRSSLISENSDIDNLLTGSKDLSRGSSRVSDIQGHVNPAYDESTHF